MAAGLVTTRCRNQENGEQDNPGLQPLCSDCAMKRTDLAFEGEGHLPAAFLTISSKCTVLWAVLFTWFHFNSVFCPSSLLDWDEVKHLVNWCRTNNLVLNVDKIKEIIVDFRRHQSSHTQLFINGTAVEMVSSPKFLGVQITDNITWSLHTGALVKRAQQRMHFLRRMKRAQLPPPVLTTFYTGTIESLLTNCMSVWTGACSASDWKSLQRVVRTAEKIIRTPLPPIQEIAKSRCLTRAQKICRDSSPPHQGLFSLLDSRKSFFPQAIRLLNAS
ncbi:uncharacterized protein LOC133665251 [Entelurus aequoreus]|uniref:uncharacterized protein LOC133665251 n=1 Tax=Entelurus aequoreus TaxID=161455 RepID=UPI002B1E5824|nr:uncharacterized protein LOC133665251 [Entelurus aequoreus]